MGPPESQPLFLHRGNDEPARSTCAKASFVDHMLHDSLYGSIAHEKQYHVSITNRHTAGGSGYEDSNLEVAEHWPRLLQATRIVRLSL